MPVLSSTDPACRRHLKKLLARGEPTGGQVEAVVRNLLREVQSGGDRAVCAATWRFDRVRVRAETLRVSRAELDAALASLSPPDRSALRSAARRIRTFHRKQRQASWHYTDRLGARLGQRILSLDRVGVYVPGGKAAYPSSVLMTVIPAKVAGVREVVLVSPPSCQNGRPDINRAILAAARIAGADAVFRVGGAQAIAALAYGTDTIPRVDKIVGPGNIYVATAKRMVFGRVGIDMIAGPSELLVLADTSATPGYVAADMLSQAEHDELAAPLCVTTSAALAKAVVRDLGRQLASLSRRSIATAALRRYGAVIIVRNRAEAVALANSIAPEHLELAVRNPRAWAKDIRHAGAIFLGHLSTEPFGDYIAGPSHVLPTGGSARFASPLGVYDFFKRASVIEASARSLRSLGPQVMRLAELEGLEAHARAVQYRLESTEKARTEV